MKKELLLVGALACALSLPLMGCGEASSTPENGGEVQPQDQSGDFDAVEAYYGQWHGYVDSTGQSVYGTMGGEEPMLDVYLNEDGTCSVEPVDAHADLLTDEGTWDGSEGQVVLHLTDGDITISVTGDDSAEANAADFGIDGFDTLDFHFYG